MKPFIRLALILAGSAAIPICLSAQDFNADDLRAWAISASNYLSAQAPAGAVMTPSQISNFDSQLPVQAPGGRVMAPPAPGPATPAAVSPAAPGPRIQFNTEIYEAGTNLVGDPIQYTFVVTNTGVETLVISNVIPSCGCTTVGGVQPAATSGGGTATPPPTTWSHEIAPGQTGVIPIQVATSSLRGAVTKTVEVVSNDRTRPRVVLQIHGNIWQPIEVAPSLISFTLTPGVTNLNTQVVKIFNRMDAPLDLSDPHSTTNLFSPVLKTNVPGREFELTVTVLPPPDLRPSLNSTLIQGEISLKCSMTNKNPLVITALASVPPEITIFPSSIQLPDGPLAQPSSSHIRIRENTTNITISDPAASFSGVELSLSILQTNRYYELLVVFPRDFVAKSGGNITVKTDNPHFPVLTIPVAPQQVRPAAVPAPVRTSLPAPVNPTNASSVGSAGSAGSRASLPVPPIATNTQPIFSAVFMGPVLPAPSNATNTPVAVPVMLPRYTNNAMPMPPMPPMPSLPAKP